MCLSSNQSRNKPYGLELCQQRAPTGFLAQRAMVSHQLGPGNCDAIRYTPEGEPEGEPEGKHAQVASGYSATATATATDRHYDCGKARDRLSNCQFSETRATENQRARRHGPWYGLRLSVGPLTTFIAAPPLRRSRCFNNAAATMCRLPAICVAERMGAQTSGIRRALNTPGMPLTSLCGSRNTTASLHPRTQD